MIARPSSERSRAASHRGSFPGSAIGVPARRSLKRSLPKSSNEATMVARRDERIARFALGSENRGGRLKSGDNAPELVEMLPLDRIYPDPGQPRRHFDTGKLQELADSLRAVGQIQPIIVVRAGDRYRLHVGERRWRAS